MFRDRRFDTPEKVDAWRQATVAQVTPGLQSKFREEGLMGPSLARARKTAYAKARQDVHATADDVMRRYVFNGPGVM